MWEICYYGSVPHSLEFVPIYSVHFAVPKFAISQLEAVSTVLTSCDIKNWYGKGQGYYDYYQVKVFFLVGKIDNRFKKTGHLKACNLTFVYI